jgi:hypothetical protein
MPFKTKLLIFVAAVLISFVGFSLIASPVVDVIVVGKKAGYQIITNYLQKADISVNTRTSKG